MKVISKRNIVLILTIVAVIFILVIVIIKENVTKEENILTNNNALTMMYETSLGSGEYEVVSNSKWPQEDYVFNEKLSYCENGSKLEYDEDQGAVKLNFSVTDKCYVYFDVKEPPIDELCSGKTFASCIIEHVYTSDGVNGLYYHDGIGSYTNASEEAGDNSYRYSGANPDNYVCFGSDEETCPTNNLYRIIGVFNGEVKLIKHDYANSDLLGKDGAFSASGFANLSNYKGSLSAVDVYYWNQNGTNTWSTSQLNTINLNQNYINNIGSGWSGLIANHTWQVGGYANVYSSPAQTVYDYEVGANRANTTYQAKIGLMYVSDYGYAASPDNWNTPLFNYSNDTNINNNWMYMGLYEWTISRYANNSNGAFSVDSYGSVSNGVDGIRLDWFSIRPSFYLDSSVVYAGGNGTSADPFRINLG